MNLKTVGDLRKLLKKNDGQLDVGCICFKLDNDDGSIDVFYQQHLVAYYPSALLDDAPLDDEKFMTITINLGELKEAADALKSVQRENEYLRSEFAQLGNELEKTREKFETVRRAFALLIKG